MLKLDTSRSNSVDFVCVDIDSNSIEYKWKNYPATYRIYKIPTEQIKMFGNEKISIGWLLNKLQDSYNVKKREEINTSQSASVDFIYHFPSNNSLIYKWSKSAESYIIYGVSQTFIELLKCGKFSIGTLLNEIQLRNSPVALNN